VGLAAHALGVHTISDAILFVVACSARLSVVSTMATVRVVELAVLVGSLHRVGHSGHCTLAERLSVKHPCRNSGALKEGFVIILEDMRREFPTAHCAPDPDCEYCHGSGTRGPRKVICVKSDLRVVTEERPEEGHQPCICIFVDNPKIRKLAIQALRKLAAEARGTGSPSGRVT